MQPPPGGYPPHPGYGPPPQFPPPGGGYPVPAKKSRLGLWIGLGLGAMTMLVVIAVVVVVVIVNAKDDDTPKGSPLAAGDDSVHPAEIADVPRPESLDFAPMPSPPSVRWTSPRLSERKAAPSALVLAAPKDARSITVIDAQSGRTRFDATLPGGTLLTRCAIAPDRIACIAATADRHETVLIFDALDGRVVARTALPPSTDYVQDIWAVSDRFVLKRGTEMETGFMYGLDLSGRIQWTEKGTHIVADKPVIIRTDDFGPSPDKVDLLRVSDGKKFASYSSRTSNFTVPWFVYDNGVALAKDDGTGTDFYSFDGSKTSTLLGWHPALEQGHHDTAVPPVPIVGRTVDPKFQNSFIIGAANPATGHILWRATGSEYFATRLFGRMYGNLLGLRLGPIGKAALPGGKSEEAKAEAPTRLFDPISGEVRNPSMKIPSRLYVTDVGGSDGSRIIVGSQRKLTALDIATGTTAWESTEEVEYVQYGTRIYLDYLGNGIQLLAP